MTYHVIRESSVFLETIGRMEKENLHRPAVYLELFDCHDEESCREMFGLVEEGLFDKLKQGPVFRLKNENHAAQGEFEILVREKNDCAIYNITALFSDGTGVTYKSIIGEKMMEKYLQEA